MITRRQTKRKLEMEAESNDGSEGHNDDEEVKSNPPVFPDEVILSIGKALNQLGLYGTQLNLLLTSKNYSELLLPDLYRNITFHSHKVLEVLEAVPRLAVDVLRLPQRTALCQQERLWRLTRLLKIAGGLENQSRWFSGGIAKAAARFSRIKSLEFPALATPHVRQVMGRLSQKNTVMTMWEAMPNLQHVVFYASNDGDWNRTYDNLGDIVASLVPPSLCFHFPRIGPEADTSLQTSPGPAVRKLAWMGLPFERPSSVMRLAWHGVSHDSVLPWMDSARCEYHFLSTPRDGCTFAPVPEDTETSGLLSRQIDQFGGLIDLIMERFKFEGDWEESLLPMTFYGALENHPFRNSNTVGVEDTNDPVIELKKGLRDVWLDLITIPDEDDLVQSYLEEYGLDDDQWEERLISLLDVALDRLVFLPSSAGNACSECGCEFL